MLQGQQLLAKFYNLSVFFRGEGLGKVESVRTLWQLDLAVSWCDFKYDFLNFLKIICQVNNFLKGFRDF